MALESLSAECLEAPMNPVSEPITNPGSGKSNKRLSAASLDTWDTNIRSLNSAVGRWRNRIELKIPKWSISHSPLEGKANEICYSVFKASSVYPPLPRLPPEGFLDSGPVTGNTFADIVQDVIIAIESRNIQPKRISAGSSGSYFVYNTKQQVVGVFKPKDEEPYGKFAVKWTKWVHRNLFPCFFGRSCLIPNLGYICEAAASVLDRQLQTHIVPYTDTVLLSSPSFYYPYLTRSSGDLPRKEGSFQLFLDGYVGADVFFKRFPFPTSVAGFDQKYPVDLFSDESSSERCFQWAPKVIAQFQEELAKLVILDFIMRNTDRSFDNWMILLSWDHQSPVLKIGAIDSGLSFPWKHPNELRSFPFGWLNLPVALIGQSFSESTRKHFLSLLTSIEWWEETKLLLRLLFARDCDFKERMWHKQWAVLKGQAFQVVECLKTPGSGPIDLTRSPKTLVWDEEIEVPVQVPVASLLAAMETPLAATSETETDGEVSPKAIVQAENTAGIHLDPHDVDNWNQLTNKLSADLSKLTASKTVIMERLQFVRAKPAVFTWC